MDKEESIAEMSRAWLYSERYPFIVVPKGIYRVARHRYRKHKGYKHSTTLTISNQCPIFLISLLLTTPYVLDYCISLLLFSLVLTFAGTFLIRLFVR